MPEIQNPLVSIVIPTFNSQEFIVDTLESALNQTYSNIEVICVDDGSSDQTISIINQLMDKDNRLHLSIRDRLPKGGSTCRNIGAFQAEGEYLMFLDSDDILASDCVYHRLFDIRRTRSMFSVYPMASFRDDISVYKMTSRLNVKDFKYFFASGFAAWQVSSSFFSKSFFVNQLHGFDDSFQRLQDIEMHLRAIIAADGQFSVYRNAQPDCFYRKNENKTQSYRKMVTTLQSYEHFSELLIQLHQSGTFNMKRRFSLSVLVMFLTMLCTVNLLYLDGIYDYDKTRIGNIDLVNHLTWYHKGFLKCGLLLKSPTIGMIYARGLRRLCQYCFY